MVNGDLREEKWRNCDVFMFLLEFGIHILICGGCGESSGPDFLFIYLFNGNKRFGLHNSFVSG